MEWVLPSISRYSLSCWSGLLSVSLVLQHWSSPMKGYSLVPCLLSGLWVCGLLVGVASSGLQSKGSGIWAPKFQFTFLVATRHGNLPDQGQNSRSLP